MNKRLQTFYKALGLTATQFADEVGVQRSSISHVISGRNKPSMDFIEKILRRYPELNIDWLILGSGAMFKGDDLFSGAGQKSKTSKSPVQQQAVDEMTDSSDSEASAALNSEGAGQNIKDREPIRPQAISIENNEGEGSSDSTSSDVIEREKEFVGKNQPVDSERVIIIHANGTFSDYLRRKD